MANEDKVFTQAQIDVMVKKDQRAIVVFEGEVYDATDFKATHPGGPKLIDDCIGKDISNEFYDAEHTKIALRLLDGMRIGRFDDGSTTKAHTGEADNKHRMKEIEGEAWRKLIDPAKGTVYQVFTKLRLEEYNKFINDPKHLTRPDDEHRMFQSDFLEPFSRTPWYYIGLFWMPVVFYKVWQSTFQELSPIVLFALFLYGMFLWTFVEYTLHRFVFHMERYMPDNRYFITLHFILHGVHHAFPMDGDRLVFPIILAIPIYFGIFSIFCTLFPAYTCDIIMAGFVFGYLWYDMGHYYLHHSQPLKIVEFRKKYHMYHHYKDPDNGYGITNSYWDKLFGTELDMTKKRDRN